MASMEFKNNARSTVADNPLAAGATTLNVATGEGANFPSSFPFLISIWDAVTYPNPGDDPGMEIDKCTGRTTDALTIVRAQESTADVAHSNGERVAMLWTAGHFNDASIGIITKLDTIETNAKDDQTGAEIKAAYEAEADTNAFTDSEKAEVAANTVHKTSDGSDHGFIDQSVVSGASPTFVGTNISAVPADSVEHCEIGAATYDDVQDWLNNIQSSGIIEGLELDNSRTALELDVLAGKGYVKIANSEIAETCSFDFAQQNNITLTADRANYIYMDYNAGTPQVFATVDRTTIECNRQFPLGVVYKNGTTLHIVNSGVHVSNLARTEHDRLVKIDGFTHAEGATTSEIGTLNLNITAGEWYRGHNPISTNALNTSVTGSWRYTHYGVASWITDDAEAEAVDCTHYNSGADVIASMGVNNYGVQWVYISADSDVFVIYGTENGTLAAADASTPPTNIPEYMETIGELIAKIIIRQTGVIISIETTYDIVFSAAGVPNHNDTGNLNDGDYKHLTAAEKTLFDTVEENADVTDAANIAAVIVGAVAKGTPIDADTFALIDSADSNSLKEVTGTALKAYLKTYNDTLYAAVLGADDNYVTDAEKVIIGNTSGTNSGDDPANDTAYNESTWDANTDAATKNSIRDQIEIMLTAIGLNTAKDTNATHTGEVTGSGALAIDKTAISGKGVVTAVGADYVLIGDASDSDNLKKALVSDLTGAGTTITAESFSSSPAHLTTDQDAGRAFTISSFPEHAQIKKIRVRADFTAGQQSNTGSALINDGTGVAPADSEIVYDGDSPTDLFAVNDQILIDSEWMDVTGVDTGTNTLTVTRGIKGTMAAYHDDNAVITKGNHGIRVVLFKDSDKKYSERIIELSSMMTYKGVTDAAISENDDYFGLTADVQNLGNSDFLVIEDTAEEICKVQNVNHNVENATYDYTIFVQGDLAAHDSTKIVKKVVIFDLDVPYISGAGTLYGTVFVDEKIVATVNVKVEIETDSYT